MKLDVQQVGITPSNQMSEASYRSLKSRLSYSNLKTYATNRSRFFKECIIGEVRDEDKTLATTIGDIVHCLMADKEDEFDNKFHICSAIEPTGQVLELCQALYKRAVKGMSKDDEGGYRQTESFEVLFTDAVNIVKYDRDMKEIAFKGKNLETILKLFTEPDKKGAVGELYYKEMLSCIGKTVVTVNNIQRAEKLVEELKTHPHTRDIANLKSGEDVEVFNELVILYEIDGVEYRSMLDKLVVDHKKKLIISYDYKCTYSVEDSWEYNYLKNMYYLQAGLYDTAVYHWKREHGLDYKHLPMHYIAVDTVGTNAPVIYKLTDKDIEMAKHGFMVRGKKYQGVLSIQQAIQWHLETGIWNTAQSIHEKGGIATMEIEYERI